MAILSSIPLLHCRTIEATLDFYLQLLQFVVVNKREVDGRLYWVHLMHGDTTLMLQTVNHQTPETVRTRHTNISLYFFVNDINELHHFIKAKDYLVSEITITDYKTQEFSLSDPEGNVVTVGQTV